MHTDRFSLARQNTWTLPQIATPVTPPRISTLLTLLRIITSLPALL